MAGRNVVTESRMSLPKISSPAMTLERVVVARQPHLTQPHLI